MLEHEIELLIAINRMGLSQEQLQQLQQILGELQAPQRMHMQHREELRQFLLSWQGAPEEFDQALQNFQQERQQQRERLQSQNRELWGQLKDVLTYRQGERLYQALRKLSVPQGRGGMGMPMRMGDKDRPPTMGMGPSPAQPGMGPMGMMQMMRMMQQHMQRMRPMMPRMEPMQGGMGRGKLGRAPAPSLEELIERHIELLERVIAQKLRALQGQ